jgi:hypothetical protein
MPGSSAIASTSCAAPTPRSMPCAVSASARPRGAASLRGVCRSGQHASWRPELYRARHRLLKARERLTSFGLELPLYGFHMVLGHSRDAFVGLVGSQDLVTFWACHRAAFSHFGGMPKEILHDRTKTVVRSHVSTERREGDRVCHPEALACAHHYGFKLRLCRPYRPADQGQGRVRRRPPCAVASCAATASPTTSRPTASGRPGTPIATGERCCRAPRRCERVALPDPVERSVSLASVLGELPDVEVHRRSWLSTRRWPVAELLNERIRRNAGELRLHGIASSPDDLIERAEADDHTSPSAWRWRCLRGCTRGSTIVTSNKAVGEWAQTFGDEVLAAATLDRLLHDAEVLSINGPSFRLKGAARGAARAG